VRILNWHEIVNDHFGAEPVAVTYCPLCGTGIAFDARVARSLLNDRVGGETVRIQYDRRHRSAEAFDAAGRQIATVTAYWFAWVAFHPKTEVLTAP
jgi:hypothetical protein